MIFFTGTSLLIMVLAFGQHNCQSAENSGCDQIVQRCNGPLLKMMKDVNDPLELDLTTVCDSIHTVKTCLGSCFDAIIPRHRFGPMINGIQYVCNPSVQGQFNDVSANAECLLDPTFIDVMDTETLKCSAYVTQGILAGIPLCPLVKKVINCVMDKIGEVCGPKLVPLFSDLAHTVFRKMMPQGLSCFNEHNIVKRAVQMIARNVGR